MIYLSQKKGKEAKRLKVKKYDVRSNKIQQNTENGN